MMSAPTAVISSVRRPSPQRVAYSIALLFGVTMLWFTAQGFMWLDDYELQSLAFAADWLDTEYLTQPWGGHFMPAGFALAQVLAKLTPFTYVPMSVIVALGMTAFALSSARLFLFILGNRWVALLPLGLVLASGAIWDSATWWIAALNAVPLLIAIPLVVLCHLRWLRDGSFRHGVLGWLIALAACLFFEKALGLIAFIGVITLVLRGRWPTLHARRQVWTLLVLYTTTVAGFTFAYLVSTTGTVARPPDIDTLVEFLRLGGLTFPPLLLGGPWVWASPAIAATPLIPAVIATNVLVFLALWQSVRSRRAALLWLSLVAYVLALIVIVASGRAGWGVQVIAQPRYFAEAVVYAVIAACISYAYLVPKVGLDSLPQQWRRVGAATLAVVSVQVVVLGLATTLPALSRSLADNPSRVFVVGAINSLSASDDIVNNGLLPGDVLWPLTAPQNQLRPFFAPLFDAERFPDARDSLSVINPFGGIRPGTVIDLRATPADDACPYILRQRTTTVLLPQPVADYWHTVSFSYVAGASTSLKVAVGSGAPVEIPIAPGLHEAFVFLEGAGDTLVFTRISDGVGVCISDVRIGFTAETLP
jgi:hypothetical protein